MQRSGLSAKRIPRTIGFGAGLLALVLAIYSAAGAVWGLFRPELRGTQTADGGYAISNIADVQFTSFITFVIITGALSVVLGLSAYLRAQAHSGARMVYWVGIVALLGAAAFFVAGGLTATHAPEEAGKVVQFVPNFAPGIAWAVSPFMAMFSYWSAAFVGGEEAET